MRLTALFAAALSLTAACVEESDTYGTDEVVAPDDDGKADAATELSVRVGETTVTVDRVLVRRGNFFVMHGRTSRNITDLRAWIFDDIFGDWAQPSPRVFEISYGTTWGGPLFDGVDLFTGIDFVPSANRPTSLYARTTVQPRLGTTSGSSSLSFTAELTPIVVNGGLMYRLQGRATKPLTSIAATAGATAAAATLVDATHYTIDLTRAQISTNAGVAGTPIVVTGVPASGGAVVRRAALGLQIKKLGMTAGDVMATWPLPTCKAAVRTCLIGLPAGALDTSTCGAYIDVNPCAREVGEVVDGSTVAAAKATIATRAADAAFEADAVGLVGADRAAQFVSGAAAKASTAIDLQGGRWYLSKATRDGVVASTIDGAFDAAYARPLTLVSTRAAAPGDAAATRQVAADALLAQIAVQNFVGTDLERTVEQLTREFRAQHVADVRAFRDGTDIELFADGANDIFIGRWLGLHTEVTIDRATGAATHVLVEID